MKALFAFIFFYSYQLMAEEYWRPPIIGLKSLLKEQGPEEFFNRNLQFLGAEQFTSVTVYLTALGKQGFDISQHNDYFLDFQNSAEYFSNSILRNNPHVVKQTEYKKNRKFLYTFYLNNCFALIINNKNNIIMLHGQPTNHPDFKADLKKAKKLLSTYKGDVYLISHQNEDLIARFRSDREFNIANKPENLIASLKASKEGKKFEIRGEFHTNKGVKISNYDKLMAHHPWGPMSPIKFKKYKK